MFTGIVTSTGILQGKTMTGGDCRLHISCSQLNLETAQAGDSISVSGACLTMLEPSATGFFADVSLETLGLTTLGQLREGQAINLELALDGLNARNCLNPAGDNESGFLSPLLETAESGLTPADRKLALYAGEWGGSVDALFRECAY